MVFVAQHRPRSRSSLQLRWQPRFNAAAAIAIGWSREPTSPVRAYRHYVGRTVTSVMVWLKLGFSIADQLLRRQHPLSLGRHDHSTFWVQLRPSDLHICFIITICEKEYQLTTTNEQQRAQHRVTSSTLAAAPAAEVLLCHIQQRIYLCVATWTFLKCF